MRREAMRGDEGFVLATVLAVVVGLVLAGLASFAIVQAGSPDRGTAINAPLISYDGT